MLHSQFLISHDIRGMVITMHSSTTHSETDSRSAERAQRIQRSSDVHFVHIPVLQYSGPLPSLDGDASRSRDIISNAQSGEHELGSMVQWAPCHSFIRRRCDQTRLCNFQRFPSLTLHRCITSRHEKVTKFSRGNHGMHRMGRKGEVITCSSLLPGGRKKHNRGCLATCRATYRTRYSQIWSPDQPNNPLFLRVNKFYLTKCFHFKKTQKNRADSVLIRTKLFASSRH